MGIALKLIGFIWGILWGLVTILVFFGGSVLFGLLFLAVTAAGLIPLYVFRDKKMQSTKAKKTVKTIGVIWSALFLVFTVATVASGQVMGTVIFFYLTIPGLIPLFLFKDTRIENPTVKRVLKTVGAIWSLFWFINIVSSFTRTPLAMNILSIFFMLLGIVPLLIYKSQKIEDLQVRLSLKIFGIIWSAFWAVGTISMFIIKQYDGAITFFVFVILGIIPLWIYKSDIDKIDAEMLKEKEPILQPHADGTRFMVQPVDRSVRLSHLKSYLTVAVAVIAVVAVVGMISISLSFSKNNSIPIDVQASSKVSTNTKYNISNLSNLFIGDNEYEKLYERAKNAAFSWIDTLNEKDFLAADQCKLTVFTDKSAAFVVSTIDKPGVRDNTVIVTFTYLEKEKNWKRLSIVYNGVEYGD